MRTEEFDYLTPDGVKIIQATDGYHFTSDAVALGNFIECKNTDTVIDIGCGGGVISLLVNDNNKPHIILAVDIDKQATELCKKNVSINNMENIFVFNADARTFHKQIFNSKLIANTADVIVCNPPYFSSGRKSLDKTRRIARHDDTLTLDDLAIASTKLLKYGGLLYLCYPAKSTAKAIHILESHNFRVRELKFLQNNKGIYLVLIKCKKGSGDGTQVTVSVKNDYSALSKGN
jgi:tRNA1(Val) A37 N6-methylase TrmN6